MRLTCPHCGERDVREFEYLGSAKLLQRPKDQETQKIYDYVYLRENPNAVNSELWQHVLGCRAWLQVTRNVTTHEILDIQLASEAAGGLK